MSERRALAAAWNRLSTRERLIALACAAVLLTMLLWHGAIEPFNAWLDDLDHRIQGRELKLARQRQWRQERQAAGRRKIADNRASGSASEDMSRFLKDIEQLARAASVRIVDLKPMPERRQDGVERLGLDLQMEVSLPALNRFLFGLQSSPRLYEVNRFQLAAGESRGPLRASLLITQTVFSKAR